MTGSYKGKYIWIIGASSGIGRAVAVELATRGAQLALSARSEEKLTMLNEELGGLHQVVPLDVVDAAVFEKAAQSISENFPRLDSVIFMAAIYEPAPLARMNLQTARKIIDVNITGVLNAIHVVLPILKKQCYGQFALCGSVAGYRGLPNGQPYSASKAAVISLAESMRAEEPSLDIKVINPGFVRTKMTEKNNFTMPLMIEAEDAASIIANELLTRRFEIHFPKRFTILLKCLRILPSSLYFYLTRRLSSKS